MRSPKLNQALRQPKPLAAPCQLHPLHRSGWRLPHAVDRLDPFVTSLDGDILDQLREIVNAARLSFLALQD